MSDIGIILKKLLQKENLSENELSKRTGISQQIINRITSGTNQNPTLTTLLPIAQYFGIPLQDLVLEAKSSQCFISTKVPYINFVELTHVDLDSAIANADRFISVDLEPNKNYFATCMYDDSMEPKFSAGAILIFEKDKEASNGDFCLLRGEDNSFIFRQVIINTAQSKFIKCFNPSDKFVSIMPMPINIYVLATLLESRNNF